MYKHTESEIDDRTLGSRRAFLITLGVTAAGALAGCTERTNYEFRADAVELPSGARSELGFSEQTRDSIQVERSRSIGDVNVTATIESHIATYQSEWSLVAGNNASTILEAFAAGRNLTVVRALDLGIEAGSLPVARDEAILNPEGALVVVPERATDGEWLNLSDTLVVMTGAGIESAELYTAVEGYRVPAQACFPDDLYDTDGRLFPDELYFPNTPLAGDTDVVFFPDELFDSGEQRFPDELFDSGEQRFPDELFDSGERLFPDELFFPSDPLASSREHVIVASGAVVFGIDFRVRAEYVDSDSTVATGVEPGIIYDEDPLGKVATGINPGMVLGSVLPLVDGEVAGVILDGPCSIESDPYVPEYPMAVAPLTALLDVDDEMFAGTHLSTDTRLAVFVTEDAHEEMPAPFELVAPGDELPVPDLAVLFPDELYDAEAFSGPRVSTSVLEDVSFPDCLYSPDAPILTPGELTFAPATPRVPVETLSESGRDIAIGPDVATSLRIGVLSTPTAEALGKSLNPLTEMDFQDLLTSDYATSYFGQIGMTNGDSAEWVRSPTRLGDDGTVLLDTDTIMESFGGIVAINGEYAAVVVHVARATARESTVLAIGISDRRVDSTDGPYIGDDGYVSESEYERAVEAVIDANARYTIEG